MALVQHAMSQQTSQHARNSTPVARRTVLDRLALHNFEGHADLSLDMGKITVLIGPAGSGKSAVLRALGLLKSILGGNGHEAPSGGGGRAQVTGGSADRNSGIRVEGRRLVDSGEDVEISTRFSYRMALDGSLSPSGMDAAVDVWCGPPGAGPGTVRLQHSLGQGDDKTLVFGAGEHGDPPVQACVDGLFAPSIRAELAESGAARAFDGMFREGWYFASLLDGLRQVPLSWDAAAGGGATLDEPPRDITETLACGNGDNGGGEQSWEKVSGMFKEMGLGQAAARIAPAEWGGSGNGSAWPAARGMHGRSAGEGIRDGRPASVVAALARSPQGSVVSVEEPEIHLDPASQIALARIMVRQAVQDEKQVIFTTHSDHLLYPLLAYIEKKGHPLGPEDVAIHCFSVDKSGAAAGAERLRINEHGQVRGGLRGFWDVDMKGMDEILHEDDCPQQRGATP